MAKRKVQVSKERQVNTYSYLRHASHVILERAEKDKEGSFYGIMASLILTAFTMEAYLNHVGPRIFNCWDDLERLSPLSKLKIVAEKLGIEIYGGKRPYQTLVNIFKFRNTVAHGKSVSLKSDEIQLVEEPFDNQIHKDLKTEWEEYCTMDNANRALEDIETIIKKIHDHIDIKNDFPFSFGMQGTLSTLLPDEQQIHKG